MEDENAQPSESADVGSRSRPPAIRFFEGEFISESSVKTVTIELYVGLRANSNFQERDWKNRVTMELKM